MLQAADEKILVRTVRFVEISHVRCVSVWITKAGQLLKLLLTQRLLFS